MHNNFAEFRNKWYRVNENDIDNWSVHRVTCINKRPRNAGYMRLYQLGRFQQHGLVTKKYSVTLIGHIEKEQLFGMQHLQGMNTTIHFECL